MSSYLQVQEQLGQLDSFELNATVFNMNFKFDSPEQKAVLASLIDKNFTLYGYKAAKGGITIGVPVWFTYPYDDVFGTMNINYEPVYKVYVGSKTTVAGNTTIDVSTMTTNAIPLGTTVKFDKYGNFSITGTAPAGTIILYNDRAAETQDLVVGLAAKVQGVFKTFCAFDVTPKGSVSMEPQEQVLLFAAKKGLVSGSVVANATAPGAKMPLDASNIEYPLEMIPRTLGIKSATGNPNVVQTSSEDNIAVLLGNVPR